MYLEPARSRSKVAEQVINGLASQEYPFQINRDIQMKKTLLVLAGAAAIAGCADMPKGDAPMGVKEETYTVTGSRIARKTSDKSNVAVMDKEALQKSMDQMGNTGGKQQ